MREREREEVIEEDNFMKCENMECDAHISCLQMEPEAAHIIMAAISIQLN